MSIKVRKVKNISSSAEEKLLKKLYKMSTKLSSSLDLDETLEFVANSLMEIMEYDFCNIYLADHKDPRYVVNRFASDKEKYFEGERVFLSHSTHLKQVYGKKKPIFYCGLESRGYIKPKLLKYFRKHDINCSMCLPLTNKDPLYGRSVQGCIILDKKNAICDNDPNKLNENIMVFVNQASIAINNAIMHSAIKNQRDRWYSIYEDTSDGMAIVDEECIIKSINTSLNDMLGRANKELTDINISEIFHENEGRQLEKELKKGFEENKTHIEKKEVLLNTKSKYLWTAMKVSYIRSARDYKRAIISFEDISTVKELEQSKNDFISIVSHELRNPVTLIKGFLSLVLKKEYGKLNEKQRKFLYKALDSSDRMANLLEHILDVNRIIVGKVDLQLEAVDVLKILDIARKDLSPNQEAKNIKILLRNHVGKKVKVLADKERFYQILYNLLDNAIKYSHPNTKIRVNISEKDDQIVFSVSDSGVGISKDKEKVLFEKFSRIDNSFSVTAGGFGLGLYIVKNLIKAHGGMIEVESKEGVGATFRFNLEKYKKKW